MRRVSDGSRVKNFIHNRRRLQRMTQSRTSAASNVYKRQMRESKQGMSAKKGVTVNVINQ